MTVQYFAKEYVMRVDIYPYLTEIGQWVAVLDRKAELRLYFCITRAEVLGFDRRIWITS